ncbi:MAG: nitroreductase family protein [Thermoanaerobaculia bacterium]
MEPDKIFTDRFSCRSFLKKEVPEEYIEAILKAGIWAPSAGNLQPWRFLLITNQELKEKLAEVAYGQEFISEADFVVVVIALPEESAIRYGERGRNLYSIQDTAAAIQNMLLQASILGLGSCWVGAFSEERAKKVLNLEKNEKPVAILPFGFPKEFPPPLRKRKDLKKVVKKLE